VIPLSLRETALAGLVAAVYAVLALAFYPISFAVYQVRIAEALTVLPFVMRSAVPGLFVGCVLANIFGGMGWQDIVFGSLFTLGAALLTRLVALLPRRCNLCWLAAAPVVLLWSGGLVLLSTIRFDWWVAIAAAISGVSAIAAAVLWSGPVSRRTAAAILVLVSVLALAGSLLFAVPNGDTKVILIAALSLITAWGLTLYVVVQLRSGQDSRLLLAPLPPVLINALGVSLYLAPIIGVNYWFAVQMIGIGQLIACYLLGLPLLKLVKARRLTAMGLTSA